MPQAASMTEGVPSESRGPAPPRIYLAGPEVFLPNARAVAHSKKALCTAYGFEGVFPLDVDLGTDNNIQGDGLARKISESNEALMTQCDALIANLTPFRGVSADVGTAFEVGFMRGLGKPVYGYTNVPGDYRDRVAKYLEIMTQEAFEDHTTGMSVEDFGLSDNLMIEIAIQDSPSAVHRTAPTTDVMADLVGFEACLKDASRHVGTLS
ncbi:MAG: nucleoside 2-deoxyribosyltransferase [Pseudomonadota bacterium]